MIRLCIYLTNTYIGFMYLIRLGYAVNYIDYYMKHNNRIRRKHMIGLVCGIHASSILIGGSYMILLIPNVNILYYKILYGTSTFLYFTSYFLLPIQIL